MSLDAIVLGGGAHHATNYVGCIQYMEENQMINSIHTFVGSSSGSIVASCLALGMNSSEIFSWLVESIPHLNNLNVYGILDVVSSFGIDNGINVYNRINELFKSRTSIDTVTFKELHELYPHNKLCIAATNLTKGCQEIFSADNSPDMPVALAVRMSIGIPILYTPVLHDNQYYVDAFFSENSPLNHLLEDSTKNVIVLEVSQYHSHSTNMTWESYAGLLINTITNMQERFQIPSDKSKLTRITIKCTDECKYNINELTVNVELQHMEKMKLNGYNAIKEHYLKNTE